MVMYYTRHIAMFAHLPLKKKEANQCSNQVRKKKSNQNETNWHKVI